MKICILFEKYMLMENIDAVWKKICQSKVYLMFRKYVLNEQYMEQMNTVILYLCWKTLIYCKIHRHLKELWESKIFILFVKIYANWEIGAASIYWKTLATWSVQPRGKVIIFILNRWNVCILLVNIFSASTTNSTREKYKNMSRKEDLKVKNSR